MWQHFLHREVFLWSLVAWQYDFFFFSSDLEILPVEGQAAADTGSATVFDRTVFGVIYHVIIWNVLLLIYYVGAEHCRLGWSGILSEKGELDGKKVRNS